MRKRASSLPHCAKARRIHRTAFAPSRSPSSVLADTAALFDAWRLTSDWPHAVSALDFAQDIFRSVLPAVSVDPLTASAIMRTD